MQVLLAYKSNIRGAKDPYTSLLPIGLGYINAVLRKEGYPTQLANFSQTSWKEIESLLATLQPEVLGISQLTHNRFESLKLAELAKKINPSTVVVFGGPHATHQFQEILARQTVVDVVVMGEGEDTFLDLMNTISRKGKSSLCEVKGIAFRKDGAVISTAPRPPIADLDSIPFPAGYFDRGIGVDIHRQLEFIVTSRGCPAVCVFCSSPLFWGRSLRLRSPRAVVDEIRMIRDRYGLLYFSIRDDTFTVDKGRVMEFCRLLLEEKVHILWNCQSRVNAVDEEMLLAMKRSGCECIQFGVESGSPRVLKALGKRITTEEVRRAAAAVRQAGIHLSIYLITGVADETDEDLKASIRLIESIRPHDGQVSPLAYYPGTALFAGGVRSGRIDRDIFLKDRREAFYVREDPFVASSTKKLLKTLSRAADVSRFTAADYRAQKKLLGYCHTTNMMAGEMYEEQGDWQLAEREYREITENEPENPWGWLLLGGLYGRVEEWERGRRAFNRVLRLVPSHAPAYSALGELNMFAGNSSEAKRNFQRALSMNPFDKAAQDGLGACRT